MIRWYLKYRIRLALEQNKELPNWIQTRTNSDGELSQFAKDYARMMQQLSSGASGWMQAQTREDNTVWREGVSSLIKSFGDNKLKPTPRVNPITPVTQPARVRNSVSLRWGVCFVAALMLGCGLFFIRNNSFRTLARHESTHHSELAVTATKAVLEQGHRVADQSLVAYERTLDKVSQNLVNRLRDSSMVPIEKSGRWMGVAFKELHDGAIREQNGLIEMTKRFRIRFEE